MLCFVVYGCSSKTDKLPNILWITIEDTSPHFLSNYGANIPTTPVMDSLGRTGVVFTNAYATGAVCSSSRSTIITGLTTQMMGTGNHRSNYPIPTFIKGFPHYLKQAGYFTSNNDKTDYNIANEEQFELEAWNESSDTSGWWNRKSEQPFFSVFNFMSSHQSRTMTNPWKWYKQEILDQLPPNLVIHPEDIEMPPFYKDSKLMRKHVARIHNSLRKTDLDVKILLDRLKIDGLMENTIIFIFADHGEGMPRGKTHSIAFGHRVPFYIWFPEQYKHLSPWGINSVTESLVSFEDLGATILGLAGVDVPDHMKGTSFLSEKKDSELREYVFAARSRLDETPGLERTVFDGTYVYSRNFYPRFPVMRYQKYSYVSDIVKTIQSDAANGLLNDIQMELVSKPRPIEYLYNLSKDPWEVQNLAEDPAYDSVLQRLRSKVIEKILEEKDIHFLPEELMLQRSTTSTPFEIRTDSILNPINDIVRVADLVGRENDPAIFISFLEDEREEIRYWAAVGLGMIPDSCVPYKSQLLSYLKDSNPYVRIEIAGLLYEIDKSIEAKKVLVESMRDSSDYVVHHVLQRIIYNEQIAPHFLKEVKAIESNYLKNDRSGFNYPVVNSIEMFLHIYNNTPLYYEKMLPWMEEITEN